MPTKPNPGPFIIEDANGEQLRDENGDMVLLADEPEAEYFSEKVEHVRPFDAVIDEVAKPCPDITNAVR